MWWLCGDAGEYALVDLAEPVDVVEGHDDVLVEDISDLVCQAHQETNDVTVGT